MQNILRLGRDVIFMMIKKYWLKLELKIYVNFYNTKIELAGSKKLLLRNHAGLTKFVWELFACVIEMLQISIYFDHSLLANFFVRV